MLRCIIIAAVLCVNAIMACAVAGARVPLGAVCVLIGSTLVCVMSLSLRRGSLHTMQDGEVTRLDHPVRFWFILTILCVGVLFSLIAPWMC
jgi:hypothetical protein